MKDKINTEIPVITGICNGILEAAANRDSALINEMFDALEERIQSARVGVEDLDREWDIIQSAREATR